MTELNLFLLTHQAKFIQAQQKYLYCALCGGLGSGKSYTLAIAAFLDALHSPNAVVGIYGPTIRHLTNVCIKYIKNLLEENGFKEEKDYIFNKKDLTITSLNKQIGSFSFYSMDDPDTIIGYQTYTAHVDELDTMPTEKAEKCWDNILARTRDWPANLPREYMQYNEEWDGGKGRWEPRNKVCAYTTPEGFKFVYKNWVKQRDNEYHIVRAKTKNNPFNPSSYYKNLLKKYSGPKVEAYLEGKFVNLASGNAYHSYDPELHNSTEEIQGTEPLYIGMDFNVNNCCAAVFVPRKGGKEWHQVEELFGVKDTPQMIEYINERWADKGHKIYIYPDASSKHRSTQNASLTDLKQLQEAGYSIVRNNNKNPQRKDRVDCVNSAFNRGILFVNVENCENQSEALSQQPLASDGLPDKNSEFDDANDAFGYFCYKKVHLRNQFKVLELQFAQRT